MRVFCLLLLISVLSYTTSSNVVKLKENNYVLIRNQINEQSVNNFVHDILSIDNDVIYIYINSPGGSVHSGNAMIQVMNALSESGKEIHCIADFAASMAFVFLQACPHRHVLSNSILMQHQMSLGVQGKYEEIKNYLHMIEQVNVVNTDMQSNRTLLTSSEFNNKISNDWWSYGKNAVYENIADDQIYVLCDSDLLSKKKNEKLETFFGKITLVYSACPLMRKYIDYSFDETYAYATLDELNELLDEYTGEALLKQFINIKH